MKLKNLRMIIISSMLLLTVLIGSAFSYHGYSTAVTECSNNDGIVTENQLGILAFNWSVTCDESN
ncbi:hypothetical protein B0H94_111113 [Salsuginibacillus halophilus]|uniref:Uncharacterized protein n=1 Tax=Salsuginibacillus halophilus TaxID=517424 RepID=A0A2P8HAN0_9BACI|nr:hypothetical protein B0H94_111113 [Salsuginibacillus halophilus]